MTALAFTAYGVQGGSPWAGTEYTGQTRELTASSCPKPSPASPSAITVRPTPSPGDFCRAKQLSGQRELQPLDGLAGDGGDYGPLLAAIGKEHVDLHRSVLNDRRLVLHGPEDNGGWRVAFRRARPVFAEYATARRVTVGDADQASFNPPGLVFGIGTRR